MDKPKTRNYTDEERDALRKQVWQLWCRGVSNISAIAREVGIDRTTVRGYIDDMRAQVKERIAEGDEVAEVLSGIREVQAAAWSAYANADNANAKVGAMRVALDALKTIAGMFNISTEKSTHEVMGNLAVQQSGNITFKLLGSKPEDERSTDDQPAT
jgi:transposase-like protein